MKNSEKMTDAEQARWMFEHFLIMEARALRAEAILAGLGYKPDLSENVEKLRRLAANRLAKIQQREKEYRERRQ